jgi:hypothetical protein
MFDAAWLAPWQGPMDLFDQRSLFLVDVMCA